MIFIKSNFLWCGYEFEMTALMTKKMEQDFNKYAVTLSWLVFSNL